jgi:leucyl-tRNA synthetase
VKRYNPKEIEPRWQKIWDETGVYTADLASDKPKYLAMSMFNYPSGAGIHIGHAMNYTISDVKARFKRQQSYESYHPVGWDAFGLPAENYAIKSGVSPQESMANIIPMYHKQYKAMGWSNDWEKEISTHLPEYYQWSQWLFTQMYKHGLAYQESRLQWWCAKCQTVLANEQVLDGKCWRHDAADDPPVEKREVKQWFFKITDYADELLEATDSLDWTESVKLAQKNWIGRSYGAEITFQFRHPGLDPGSSQKSMADSHTSTNWIPAQGWNDGIRVFTTRPDTIFGATFLVLAPEHELVQHITSKAQKAEVDKYVKTALGKSEVERQESKEKTGVFTGAYAINPASGEQIPIWVADYVLTGYGTGAIMAVPAHDERDYEFAQKFDLPIKFVVEPTFGEAQGDDVHSEKVFVALRDPKTQQVLTLDWGPRQKNYGGQLLIGGSLEGEETYQEAAEREIREETGYQHFKLVKEAEFKGHGYFYSNTKDLNVHASGKGLLFDLIDATQTDAQLDSGEKNKFKLSWQPIGKIATLLDDGVHEAFYRYLVLGECYHGEGVMANSGAYNGMPSAEAREKIVKSLSVKGQAFEKVNYRMRDWSVSRQRYWGAPIPIIHCGKCGAVPVPDDDLPVVLPELTDFQPSGDGRSALARAKDWLAVDCPKCGGKAERETDTLDTYVDSSFYMYRYLDPHNQEQIFDSEIVKPWELIDFYNGADHATAHLLYARFIGHFFQHLGLVNEPEPFKQFLFNGKITAPDGEMFSKSKGNGVDPLEIIAQGYGADALRTYLMFASPLELWTRWDPQGVPGTYRFLNRVWNLVQEYQEASETNASKEQQQQIRRASHQMVKKVTEDIEHNRYNTAIAAAMEHVNTLYKLRPSLAKNDVWQTALANLVACIAPFAPFVADELWQQLGHSTSVHRGSWPEWDDHYQENETVTIAVQINGKVRGQISLAKDASESEALAAAQADPKIQNYLHGHPIRKTIYLPARILNLVV